MKRLISFLIAISLVVGALGMTPISAAAVATDTLIETVAVTVPEPVVGRDVRNTVPSLPSNADYMFQFYWVDSTLEEIVEDGQFLDGHKYYLCVLVEPASGYTFSQDAVVTLNGQEPLYLENEQTYIYLEQSWSFLEQIPTVELPQWPTGVQAGDSVPAQLLTVPAGANYQAVMSWVDMETAEQATVLESGKIYACGYAVMPNAGYEVTEDTVITVGGKDHDIVELLTNGMVVLLKYYAIGMETVDTLSLAVEEPEIGAVPGEAVCPAGQPCQVQQSYWMYNASGDMDDSAEYVETFQEGQYHYLAVSAYAGDGYAFADDLKVYVNGQLMEAEVLYLGDNVIVVIPFGKLTDRLPGDVNSDGEVDGNDATLLLQYAAGWEVAIDEAAGDVNADGETDGNDATLLLQYAAGWNVTLQ